MYKINECRNSYDLLHDIEAVINIGHPISKQLNVECRCQATTALYVLCHLSNRLGLNVEDRFSAKLEIQCGMSVYELK